MQPELPPDNTPQRSNDENHEQLTTRDDIEACADKFRKLEVDLQKRSILEMFALFDRFLPLKIERVPERDQVNVISGNYNDNPSKNAENKIVSTLEPLIRSYSVEELLALTHAILAKSYMQVCGLIRVLTASGRFEPDLQLTFVDYLPRNNSFHYVRNGEANPFYGTIVDCMCDYVYEAGRLGTSSTLLFPYFLDCLVHEYDPSDEKYSSDSARVVFILPELIRQDPGLAGSYIRDNLNHESFLVRAECVRAAMFCPEHIPLEKICPLIDDKRKSVRRNALDTVGRLGERAVSFYPRVLEIARTEIGVEACKALCASAQIGGATPEVLALLANHWSRVRDAFNTIKEGFPDRQESNCDIDDEITIPGEELLSGLFCGIATLLGKSDKAKELLSEIMAHQNSMIPYLAFECIHPPFCELSNAKEFILDGLRNRKTVSFAIETACGFGQDGLNFLRTLHDKEKEDLDSEFRGSLPEIEEALCQYCI